MPASTQNGQVITFYSFKGGTGRSMALANLACLLASRSKSEKAVLMVDWDLEAPGLHRYFYNQLSQESEEEAEVGLESRPGLIDLFHDLACLLPEKLSSIAEISEHEVGRTLRCLPLDRYVIKTAISSLSLLKAGKFDATYSTRVNSFDWEKLHSKTPQIFRIFAQFLSEQYEFVLVDSRTGITDTSGICTMLLPEKLVVVFTPNRQSLTGVNHLMQLAANYRKQSNDLRPLLMFPLVSRIEPTENTLRKYWRYGNTDLGIVGYQGQFEECFKEIYGLETCSLDSYFEEVLLQHVPSFAYGERIAVLDQSSGDGLVLKRRYQNLLNYVLRPTPPWVFKDKEIYEDVKGERQAFEAGGLDFLSDCPYPGLRPFEQKDQRFFFGREQTIERILNCLISEPRLLALLGPSGCGKTSLINAGLIPRLREGVLPTSGQWKIYVCRITQDPFQDFVTCGLQGEGDGMPMAVSKFLEENPNNPRLLLIIDQFEDIFLLNVDKAMRERFIEQLIRLLSSDISCIVLIAMRADFYAQLVRDAPGVVPWIEKGLINLPSILSREELRDIVEKPAQVAGISFEEGLVEKIVDDVVRASSLAYGDEAPASSAMLPLLQFSLLQLWEGKREGYLSHLAYKEIGGLAGGLVKHAEKAFSSFSREEREQVKQILTSLISIREDTTFFKRGRSLSEFNDNARLLVERLIDAHLIYISDTKEGQGKGTIELSHEALIHYWPRMREWLDTCRKALLDRTLLENRAKKWAELGKPWLSGLATGREFHDFQQAGEDAEPLTKEFLEVSRKARWLWMGGGFIVLLLLGGITWLWQKGYNLEQAILKVQSLGRSIHRAPEMVLIPKGMYQQGDVEGLGEDWRNPVRTISVQPFAMGKHEVTFEEYDRFAIATNRKLPEDQGWGRGDRPVINVSWEDAKAFAVWLSEETGNKYRLATESEWEYAARSGVKQEVWSGTSEESQLGEYAVYSDNSEKRTAVVGSKQANSFRLKDMSGNVWEWVEDCWHWSYKGAPLNGSAWLEGERGDCEKRVIRSGSWYDKPNDFLTSFRSRATIAYRENGLGFRVVQDIR